MRVALLLTAALAAGCSGSASDPNELTPHPVSGRVVYDGKPAEGVQVTLIPIDAPVVPRIPRNPHGTTKADGTFTISTFGNDDGAPEGGYQVVLFWPSEKNENAESEAQEITDKLLDWYDGTHSTINVRIKSGANDLPAINAPKRTQPPPKSEGVPGRN